MTNTQVQTDDGYEKVDWRIVEDIFHEVNKEFVFSKCNSKHFYLKKSVQINFNDELAHYIYNELPSMNLPKCGDCIYLFTSQYGIRLYDLENEVRIHVFKRVWNYF